MGPPRGSSARLPVMVDKFSALPFDLAHRILSPLPLADLARLSCLSKGLRSFHLLNPVVNFTGFSSESVSIIRRRLALLNSLDRFLILRGNNRIQSFSVHWICNYRGREATYISRFDVEKSRIIGWLRNAVRCNVESLTVLFRALKHDDCIFPTELRLPFPCCVFDCESLRSLIVDMRCIVLKASSFATSRVSNLVCLRLTYVTIEDNTAFCEWVSDSCRFLKELLIEHVTGLEYVAIESSSLELFSWNSVSSFGTTTTALDLNCPNLKRLKWIRDTPMLTLFMGESNCLEEVELKFINTDGRANFIRTSDYLLLSICSVKALVLDPLTLMVLFDGHNPPTPFLNLWSLHIQLFESLSNDIVPALASLLKGASNLNTLDITSKSPSISKKLDAFGYSREYWTKPGLFDFTSQLREVTLALTNGTNGIALGWHILENAKNLKKMDIICSPILPYHYHFVRKLNETRNISSTTTYICL